MAQLFASLIVLTEIKRIIYERGIRDTDMLERLSALTPPVVDTLYNITPRHDEEPTFVFMVGAPGSGKSTGHVRAIEAGLIQPGAYATINLDILLENLLPFRAASSIAHYLKRNPPTRDLVRFATISAYGSRKENLGLFKWYDDAHDSLAAADPAAIRSFNRVRTRFTSEEVETRLLEINEEAIQRAIANRNTIVYETTLSLTKAGRVNKVDAIMRTLKGTGYKVVFYHIRGTPEDITARIRARQEHGTTSLKYPFYRWLPTSKAAVASYIRDTQEGFDAVRKQYHGAATFEEFDNPTDVMRLPKRDRRSARTRRRQIVRAYASSGPESSSTRSLGTYAVSTNLYVSPPSTSSDLRLSNSLPSSNLYVSSAQETPRSK